MSELAALRTFYRFNDDVRRRYLDAILAIPVEERLKDRGASYPSLQEIYVHVLDALRFWFELVPQDRATEARTLELPAHEFDERRLRHSTDEVGRLVSDFLAPLRPEDLARDLSCHFPGPDGRPGEPTAVRIGDLLWHMVEEELQHRGELNALLWQMDIEPPLGSFDQWDHAKVEGMYLP